LVVKSTGVNSVNKLYIIQNIDRKLSLMISPQKGLKMDDLIKKWNKYVLEPNWILNIGLDDDDDEQEEIHDYFMESNQII
jgi:ATP-dependent DNA helicase RecQ